MVETEKHARADAFLVNFSHNKFLDTSFSLKNIRHRLWKFIINIYLDSSLCDEI